MTGRSVELSSQTIITCPTSLGIMPELTFKIIFHEHSSKRKERKNS